MGISLNISHKRIQKGDVKEFEKLFHAFYTPLCNFAYGYTKDMDEAEEIVQQLFYNYWKNKENIKIKVSIKSYLYQATKNGCLKFIEHNKVKGRYSNHVLSQNTEAESTQSKIEEGELAEIIEETINSLPHRSREVFMLSRFEGLKYAEIAKKLSISIKTVEANMGKALKLIRLNLARYDQTTL
ncbi:MAG: RNA polymerase sigma-70 factor [Bacteroidales bacterium]|nr:RNA polymerase sigma-70 factor [Bacteroidales bacterium]MDD3892430.1 RNA polymerase sigma-70 factor [Bacteroidales bacterium]